MMGMCSGKKKELHLKIWKEPLENVEFYRGSPQKSRPSQ